MYLGREGCTRGGIIDIEILNKSNIEASISSCCALAVYKRLFIDPRLKRDISKDELLEIYVSKSARDKARKQQRVIYI